MTSFAPIDGLPGYIVSSEAQVYGPDGEVRVGTSAKRYHAVNVLGKTLYLHRVVAIAFIPNPENKKYVAHWDNDGHHNEAANLRWATHRENMADKIRHRTHVQGERHGSAKLSDKDVLDARRLREEGWDVDRVAAEWGVSRWTIYDAWNPKRRKLSADF